MPTYVYDGYIEMDSEETVYSSEYMTILVKFPANSFSTSTTVNNDFNYYLNMANEGATPYKHKNNNGISSAIAEALPIVLGIGIPLIVIILRSMLHKKKKYGYKNNKTIDKANTPLFREIPCNKDMYYANCLVSLNDKLYKEYQETNIFGAIILKWVKENKVTFKVDPKGIFNKDSGTMDLTLNPTFDDPLEKELFDIMYSASKDGILEPKELENWCDNHYTKFFNLFKRINKREIEKLKANNHIYIRTNSNECKYKNVMDDTIYEDSIQLYGLKKYFDEFTKIDTKEVIEVHLWDEYLMFAYIFGIANRVAKQLKDLYPEVLNDPNVNIDYSTLMYIDHISYNSVHAASVAMSRAESYSSGGGGFSSGGGGGGSFGGGGGGGGGFR